MLIARHFLFLTTSLGIAFTWGVPATAQSLPSSEARASDLLNQPENRAFPLIDEPINLFQGEPTVKQIEQMGQQEGKSPNLAQEISPTNPTQVSQQGLTAPVPQELGPSNASQLSVPATERIKSTQPFNPAGNPLNFPTKPQEVEVDLRQPITLEQAIELGIRNNRDLQNARISLEESRAALREQQAALYPSLTTEGAFTRNRPAAAVQNAGISGAAGASSRTNVFGNIRLTYNIYTGGERDARIRSAERQLRSQQVQVEVTAEQTRFDVTQSYYELQRADAEVAIALAAVEDFSQTLRDARLLEQAGLGTRFDVLRAEADLAAANQALTLAVANQRTARRQLAETLSLGQNTELTAADEIEPEGTWKLSLEESIVQAYKNRGELEQFLLAREIAEQERLVALAGIKPQVDFLAEYNYNDNFNDSLPVATGYNFQTRVRWEFFDGGRAFAGARQANRRIDAADTSFANQRNEIRFQVEENYYSLIANGENIESTRLNVISREEQLRLARLRFQAGVGTQTDVIDAQRDLADARGAFLDAIVDYNQSLNGLQRAVSNLPTNGLFNLQTQP